MTRRFGQTHNNGMYEEVTLEEIVNIDGSKEYYVDMGCTLWNRYYKRKKSAEAYIAKCGFVEKEM